MNVLIIEIGGSHIECVYSFVHFLKIKNHQVHLACNEKLLPLFPEKDRLSGIISLPNEFNLIKQLKTFFRIRAYVKKNNIDNIIINTTEIKLIRNLSFFIPRNINCTGLVHHAKKLEKSTTFEKFLSRKMRKYFVLSDFLLNNTKVNSLFEAKAFYPVYFPKTKRNDIHKPHGEFWVVVPGEANQQRRDYVSLINEISTNHNLHNITFIFLGKNKLTGLESYENIISDKMKIISFTDQVDYDTFHQYIKLSDVILPLIKMTDDNMYGNSRISGAYNLGLGYKKPFLLPSSIKNNTDLNSFSVYYDNMKQLAEQIQLMKSSHNTTQTIQEAYQNSKFNNIDLMADEVCSFIFKNPKK
jgi:hypothetical protein